MNADFLKSFLKKKNNRILYIIFIMGIVLMLFAGRKTSEKTKEEGVTYRYSEQEELSRIISEIKGVSDAEVMVTYYGSVTSNIVYDTRVRGDETDRTAVVSDGEAVSAGESYPRVKGVVVVAKGKPSEISEKITKAVCTALDIPEYKVAVIVGE